MLCLLMNKYHKSLNMKLPNVLHTGTCITLNVFLVWDKTLRRAMLYHKDDWTWPLWVWDDH